MGVALVALSSLVSCKTPPTQCPEFKPVSMNVRSFGAKGDGKTLDTAAINRAIEAANDNGGGTVNFPAGQYLCASIHLKSNVGLYLDHGAVIIAAEGRVYDSPEQNSAEPFQDFGHTHFHNSLFWGENLENISITGPGLIWGRGLSRGDTDKSMSTANIPVGQFGFPSTQDSLHDGVGNKTISLKRCRNVLLRDISILHGGHFAVLATGVDNFIMDGVKIDTNRDGVDFDCCRYVHMSNCSVNSPHDDGICLKSSFALGEARATENVTITNCQVSAYDEGSLLDGTRKRTREGGTGRIKFGTESNGGFKNITISNCTFDWCCGLALETVDGGMLEDVTITNITMRDIFNSPIFLRLGARLRGPEGTAVGGLRRVTISNVVCYRSSTKTPCIISGIPGHNVEDVQLHDIRIWSKGGGTAEMAALHPPEHERGYPEPSMFGDIPASGLFARHVNGLKLHDVEFHLLAPDARPEVVTEDVTGYEKK